ncbi:hypothetical protein RN001_010731 [Aquatica leii]|uniref:Serpin domain-containing protein n=1 Tax=Aquatica leii TaxID=1421715 RepID=A0AAN7Q3I2_9COLE|nr:hypothetical protein RN001_010731 [Aquatica leii]
MKIVLLFFNVALVWANDDVETFLNSNREFSANVYKELAKDNYGNFVACPISLDIILSLLYVGARGQTAKQLASTVILPRSNSLTKALIRIVLRTLKDQPDPVTLKIANKIYVADELQLSNRFTNTALNVFKTNVENIDFRAPEGAVHKVNNWVSDQTDNYIKDLISESDVTSYTRAILVNALYFKATWISPFSRHRTRKARFYVNERRSVLVDMMQTTGGLAYYEDDNLRAKFLEIPYTGQSLSMVVVLPEKNYGLSHLEENISKVLNTKMDEFKSVYVKIPKFKIESAIDFVPILEKLGTTDLFTKLANLDGIAGKDSKLYVDKVIQKSCIEVAENGTVAASATAAMVPFFTSGSYSDVEFIADHPFIYYIKSAVGILFIGRYAGHE